MGDIGAFLGWPKTADGRNGERRAEEKAVRLPQGEADRSGTGLVQIAFQRFQLTGELGGQLIAKLAIKTPDAL